MLNPAFDKNNVAIVLPSDNNFVPILSVTLSSLVKNSSLGNNYDIFVLTDDITEHNQKKLKTLVESNNISLRFVNVKENLNRYDLNIFFINGHFKLPTYYRFFIPELFENFDKILYLDSDMIIMDDVAKIYNLNIQSGLMAVKDPFTQCKIKDDLSYKGYCKDILKLKNLENYFQNGVVLYNIKFLRDFDFTNKCINTLKEIETPKHLDQCVMNSIMQGYVDFVDLEWNTEWYVPLLVKDYKNLLQKDLLSKYIKAYENPKILHYASYKKPWFHFWCPKANYFWQYFWCSNFKLDVLKITIEKYIKTLKYIIIVFILTFDK